MPRGRKPRFWIKVDCEGVLRGSINYLLPLDGQAVWIKMIAYSEVCGGRPGWIEDNNGNGLPHDFIAQELHCPLEVLELVIGKMKEDKAIDINGTGSIHLVNFEHYQFGEYDRQKPYRFGQQEAEKVKSDSPKKSYGEFSNVTLTDEEHAKLIERFGKKGANDRIENLSSAIASKGYKYKSHYATILTWERMDTKRGIPKNGKAGQSTTREERAKILKDSIGKPLR